jgi:negative regulator of sigma E activity
MHAHGGGYVLVPEGQRIRPWEAEAPSIRAMAFVVAVTFALVGTFSALSHTSSEVRKPSTQGSQVERTIADPVVVDYTRTPGPDR